MPYTPPKAPTAPAKPMGLLIGLGIAGGLCVVLGGAAAWLWTGKSAAEAKATSHETRAQEVAAAIGQSVAAGTNGVVDWKAAWQGIVAGVSNNSAAVQASQARVSELEAQVDQLVLEQAKGQQSQADLQRRTTELAEANAALASLRESSQQQAAAADARLAELQKQLEEAKAVAEQAIAAAQAAPVPAPAAEPATGGAPAPSDAAAAPDAAAPAAAAESPAEDVQQKEEAAPSGQFVFPPRTSKLLKAASYDDAGQEMDVVLSDGQKLRYREVPAAIFEGLTQAPSYDTYFRMRIVGTFKSTPNDRDALRKIRVDR